MIFNTYELKLNHNTLCLKIKHSFSRDFAALPNVPPSAKASRLAVNASQSRIVTLMLKWDFSFFNLTSKIGISHTGYVLRTRLLIIRNKSKRQKLKIVNILVK